MHIWVVVGILLRQTLGYLLHHSLLGWSLRGFTSFLDLIWFWCQARIKVLWRITICFLRIQLSWAIWWRLIHRILWHIWSLRQFGHALILTIAIMSDLGARNPLSQIGVSSFVWVICRCGTTNPLKSQVIFLELCWWSSTKILVGTMTLTFYT